MTICALILPCARKRPVFVLPRGRAAPYSEIRGGPSYAANVPAPLARGSGWRNCLGA
jgi:hypothetical protein